MGWPLYFYGSTKEEKLKPGWFSKIFKMKPNSAYKTKAIYVWTNYLKACKPMQSLSHTRTSPKVASKDFFIQLIFKNSI